LCDVDFGHGFWTPAGRLVAGEWLLLQKRIWTVAWLVSYLGQLLHDVSELRHSELRQAGRTVDQAQEPANAPWSSTTGWPSPCTSCQVGSPFTST
jgi:hypothetical protein